MQQLMLQLVFFPVTAVECILSIFGISCQRMPLRSKMCTDLMRTSRDQSYFEKGHFTVILQRFVNCLDRLCFFLLLLIDRYFILFRIFVQITLDVLLLAKDSLYNTEVFLMYRPVVE